MRLQERATRFFWVTVSTFLGLALCLVGCGGDNPMNAPSIEAIADQIVDVGGQVKVEVILIDADSEDIYALRVSSDHTGVALASLNGAILTLTGVAVGTATITVSATDASGQQGNEVTFEVTVVKPVAPTVTHEREALVALYEATDGPNWTMNTNWLTDHGLAWHGVRVIDGHVTELDLQANGLSGELPDALGNLSNLEYLHLGTNNLSGGIPDALGNLSNLEYLSLSFNALSGEIPSSLGNLSNLEYLSLSFNALSGEIPSSLGNLSNLESLDLYLNDLSGGIPSSLGNLSNLTNLRFTYNRSLTGSLPQSLTKLLRLETFWFDDTGLCAPVDADFQSWLDGIDSARGVDCP